MIKILKLDRLVVEGAKVEADLVENGKNRTILIFQKKKKTKF